MDAAFTANSSFASLPGLICGLLPHLLLGARYGGRKRQRGGGGRGGLGREGEETERGGGRGRVGECMIISFPNRIVSWISACIVFLESVIQSLVN